MFVLFEEDRICSEYHHTHQLHLILNAIYQMKIET